MLLDLESNDVENVVTFVNQSLITASERALEDPLTPKELIHKIEDIQRLH